MSFKGKLEKSNNSSHNHSHHNHHNHNHHHNTTTTTNVSKDLNHNANQNFSVGQPYIENVKNEGKIYGPQSVCKPCFFNQFDATRRAMANRNNGKDFSRFDDKQRRDSSDSKNPRSKLQENKGEKFSRRDSIERRNQRKDSLDDRNIRKDNAEERKIAEEKQRRETSAKRKLSEGRNARDVKEVKDTREIKSGKEMRDSKNVKNLKEIKSGRESKDLKAVRDVKRGKDQKDGKFSKEGKESLKEEIEVDSAKGGKSKEASSLPVTREIVVASATLVKNLSRLSDGNDEAKESSSQGSKTLSTLPESEEPKKIEKRESIRGRSVARMPRRTFTEDKKAASVIMKEQPYQRGSLKKEDETLGKRRSLKEDTLAKKRDTSLKHDKGMKYSTIRRNRVDIPKEEEVPVKVPVVDDDSKELGFLQKLQRNVRAYFTPRYFEAPNNDQTNAAKKKEIPNNTLEAESLLP